MIIIRFSQSYTPSSPPVILRFAGNEEPVPAWPIVLPNLVTAKLTRYQTPMICSANLMRKAGSAYRHVFVFGHRSVVECQRSYWPSSTAMYQSTHRVKYDVAAHSAATRLGSIAGALNCRNTSFTWSDANAVGCTYGLVNETNALHQSTRTAMNSLQAIEQINYAAWFGKDAKVSSRLSYGPAPAKWICSSKYVSARGLAKIRFDNKPSSLYISFEIPAQFCQWNEGGGYKSSHDVLPVIDFVIPIEPVWRRSYVMQPTITCERLSDGQAIAISGISISKRRGNFAKSVSVTFQSKIDSDRARNHPLKVTINGYEHRVVIEQFSKSLSFGTSSYQGQGRSIVALLASPYQLPVTFANPVARSLVGVLSDLLDGSGWTVIAEGFSDFTIPPGAFSIQGKAPIEAIAAQLDGLGLMLLTNDITKELRLAPKWPVVPWLMENQNPAIVFHEGVIQSLSESEEINTLCNGVHVRGEQVGVKAHVKRSGSAGDVTPNDISHPLIVTSVAAQLCGTAALSETGRKRVWQLTAPVMANLPIVTEGQLVGIRDELNNLHRAMVDSWTVTASISADGAITVKQSFSALEPLEV